MKYTYLTLDLLTVLIPFIFSFHPRLRFYKTWGALLPAILLPAAVFIVWDYFFTRADIWGFNPTYLTGIRWFGLPMEEVLFFVCIPYACVFTYYCLNLLFQLQMARRLENLITGSMVVSLCFLGISFSGRAYTFTSFLSLSLLLLIAKFLLQVNWLGRFYMVYALLILPFMIVNGILTGSWIDSAVVWYDDSENLGIRVGTIPVEDIFYGMALILFNLMVFIPLSARKDQRDLPLFFKDLQQTE